MACCDWACCGTSTKPVGAAPAPADGEAPKAAPQPLQKAPPLSSAFPQALQKALGGPVAAAGAAGAATIVPTTAAASVQMAATFASTNAFMVLICMAMWGH